MKEDTDMARFGFSTETSAGGDFTPIVKYDARSGRMFRIDRIQGVDGFDNDPIDITATFKACFDLEGVETGWMLFAPGTPPSLKLIPLAVLDAGGTYPEKPTPDHKPGVRFMLKLSPKCGGDKPVREIAGQSKAFLQAVEELYAQYEREKPQHPGDLPVVELVRTVPVKSAQSTNYKPEFRISGWAKRPADLTPREPSRAPVEPLRMTPPATGAQTVPPPNVMRTQAPAPQMADDDFG
jgi:hypothetical protein